FPPLFEAATGDFATNLLLPPFGWFERLAEPHPRIEPRRHPRVIDLDAVRVDVERNRRGGVPEPLLHRLDILATGEQQRGLRLTQTVIGHPEPEAFGQTAELVGNLPR